MDGQLGPLQLIGGRSSHSLRLEARISNLEPSHWYRIHVAARTRAGRDDGSILYAKVTTGKFEGKRSRGRQREKIMDGLATWLGPGKVSDILAAVKDRDLWRDMIANAYKQGT
ncbi:prostaglandin reductase 1 [Plakobranchus ocellatus]|uniref:Prostaglandin reductase 1 n=1 Tax=Plakobranchus ocellatus TaxID=259542 RepID=A0AAV3YNM5_9GAST|nr:prostaglandin reductase 1 [Plakobranchus ocellatus]